MNFRSLVMFSVVVAFCAGCRTTLPARFEEEGSPSAELVALRWKYAGRIKIGITGDAAWRYAEAFDELLNEWDPVGSTRNEVNFLLGIGEPADDGVSYFFDSGFGGSGWHFHFEDDRVVRIEPLMLE